MNLYFNVNLLDKNPKFIIFVRGKLFQIINVLCLKKTLHKNQTHLIFIKIKHMYYTLHEDGSVKSIDSKENAMKLRPYLIFYTEPLRKVKNRGGWYK